VSRAVFHILNGVKIICEHESLDLNDDSVIASSIEKAISLIDEVVQKEAQARGSVYTHDKFFKEIQTNKLIRQHIEKIYVCDQNSAATQEPKAQEVPA
jgi:hypothetical protein